jgi:hypothetical protein
LPAVLVCRTPRAPSLIAAMSNKSSHGAKPAAAAAAHAHVAA